jgi:tetratricopeptide (TPR) repeat protein
VLLKKTLGIIVAIAALALGQAAQDKEKKWKDMAEYDLFASIQKDANAAARLTNLDKWKSSYPQSDYADVRLKAYLITYQQLMKHREAYDTAIEILKADPNDQASLQEILGYIRILLPQQANAPLSALNKADLDTAGKTCAYVLSNIDTVYAADKKPQGVTDAQWAQAKPAMKNFAQWTLGWIAMVEKDTPKAESELSKTLEMDPTNAVASQQLATVWLGQQKEHPDKTPLALFEYARVATYDGPNALPAAQRQQLDAFLTKAYTTYHGSAQGLDQLKAAAKTKALPPADLKIASVVEIEADKAKADDEKRKANPMLALWNDIKGQLTGENGPAYFESMVKDAGLPGGANGVMKFKGKLISTTPENRPKELKLAIEKPDVADVTLKLEEPLPGKMEPGGDIEFSGTAKAYTKEPFMLTFEVDKDDISGWTGKGPAGAGRTGGKKAAPKKKE